MRRLIHKLVILTYPVWERLGVHVVPDHFYYPIPSRHDLPESLWSRRYDCVGLDWNIPTQEDYLEHVVPRYAREITPQTNAGLSLADAAMLHTMIRHHRPKQMIEVGSGHSTEFAAAACVLNERDGYPCALTAIEPYPSERLQRGFPGLQRLLRSKVQDVPVETFAQCDLLFIDSSHVVAIGSDVTHLVLQVLPRLKPGCLVHFHDILLPGEYWRDWVVERRLFWSEQYLLWAFLLFNAEFEVVWASRYMQLRSEARIREAFPYYQAQHRLTSFWLRRRDGSEARRP